MGQPISASCASVDSGRFPGNSALLQLPDCRAGGELRPRAVGEAARFAPPGSADEGRLPQEPFFFTERNEVTPITLIVTVAEIFAALALCSSQRPFRTGLVFPGAAGTANEAAREVLGPPDAAFAPGPALDGMRCATRLLRIGGLLRKHLLLRSTGCEYSTSLELLF